MDSLDVGTSRHDTDALALLIFKTLAECSEEDKRHVLNSLRAGSGIESGRVQLIRAAIERFEADSDSPVSKQKYERWRISQGDPSNPSATYISNAFGNSWAKAMDAIGRKVSLDHKAFRLRSAGEVISDAQAIEDLRQCADELGVEALLFRDYRRWALSKQSEGRVTLISSESFSRRFGSFAQALDLAGLRSGRSRLGSWAGQVHYSKENAIECLRRASEATQPDAGLTQAGYRDWRIEELSRNDEASAWTVIPSYQTISRCFGSWPRALLAAGLISEGRAAQNARGRGQRMSREQIASGLIRASKDLGLSFTGYEYARWRKKEVSDLTKERPACLARVRDSFGSWPDALDAISVALQQQDPISFLAAIIAGSDHRD